MLQEIENLTSKLNHLDTENWLQNDVFSYQWWIILIANAIFFAVLLVLMDRKRIFQIALTFMICYVIVCIVDDIGEYYLWWSYPHQLIPSVTEFDTVDFAIVPVTFTLIYQTFKSWKTFILVDVGASLIYAFVGLPLFVYLGETKLNHNWHYFYSFLVLSMIGILTKSLADFITRKDHQYKHLKQDDRKFRFNAFRSKKKAR